MALLAFLIAAIADPIRIVAVLLGIVFIWKTYQPGHRLLPLALTLLGIACLIGILIGELQATRTTAMMFAARAAIGFVANCVIAAVAVGISRLFKLKLKGSGRP
ncbi:hypothetical protein U8C32_02560 [Sinorhizobium medicae]|uniref:hypothetical protein n=1 Tax=Sinorhizobium medicae TaxID=110321 RepID=UPI000305F421|nr:hypothetical protein [Sinorhizobium medicae]WQO92525.1 hypothetical protein U8C32_02560 [Sinorhizobium medicae]